MLHKNDEEESGKNVWKEQTQKKIVTSEHSLQMRWTIQAMYV